MISHIHIYVRRTFTIILSLCNSRKLYSFSVYIVISEIFILRITFNTYQPFVILYFCKNYIVDSCPSRRPQIILTSRQHSLTYHSRYPSFKSLMMSVLLPHYVINIKNCSSIVGSLSTFHYFFSLLAVKHQTGVMTQNL